jgi:hypothetical protein
MKLQIETDLHDGKDGSGRDEKKVASRMATTSAAAWSSMIS